MYKRQALIAEEAQHSVEEIGEDDDEAGRARRAQNRKYKIQDVLKRRQIMLVQPVKAVSYTHLDVYKRQHLMCKQLPLPHLCQGRQHQHVVI